MAVTANSLSATRSIAGVVADARRAQRGWALTPVRQRLRVIRRVRELTAMRAETLARTVSREAAETLTAEILPLLEACRFLERCAEQLLSPQRPNGYSPFWMRSVDLKTHREPLGLVLIIGPANYPIFLVGVQALQAIAAGNAVLIKPGVRGTAASSLLVEWMREAGLPQGLAVVLDEAPEAGISAIRSGVDKIVVTGSRAAGTAVLAAAASTITPVVAELSGWDPVFLLRDADIQLAASALRFGVELNGGNTCIRPRIVYGPPSKIAELQGALGSARDELEFVPVADVRQAVELAAQSEYALGASIFGDPSEAKEIATLVRAGVVVINDMIAPTAHPAVSFGGRGSSGFGLTRGSEGLLEMTVLKTVATQRSRWHPHLAPTQRGDSKMFSSFARMCHGGTFTDRIRAAVELWQSARSRSKEI